MEIRIQQWLKKLHRQRLELGQIAELEAHLRDTIDELLIKGFSEEEAFTQAEQRVGNLKSIAKQEWNVTGKKERKSMMPAFVPMYFTQAWRQLRRNRMSSFITLTGLVAGLTACILLATYVKFENSYDDFHENPEQLYRLISYRTPESEPITRGFRNMPWAINEHISGVETAISVGLQQHTVVYNGTETFKLNMAITNTHVNRVFAFRQLNGDTLALDRPNTIYLTQSIARQMFGDQNPVGEIIAIQGASVEFEVVGIMRDVPGNSHFAFEAVVPSLGTFKANVGDEDVFWGFTTAPVYMRLKPSAHPDSVAAQIANLPGRNRAYQNFHAALQPVTQIHLDQTLGNEFKPQGDKKTTQLFFYIALIILIIACVNTALIAFADYIKRVREIGMRKILGANIGEITLQFLTEHFIKLLIAVPTAILFTWLLVSPLSNLMSRDLGTNLFPYLDIVAGSIGIVTIIILLSGIIPAWLVYRNQSRASLSGEYLSGRFTRMLRQGAIAAQFGMTIFLIVYMMGISNQLQFLQDTDLGYNPDNLVRIDNRTFGGEFGKLFRDAVQTLPEVELASLTSWHPDNGGFQHYDSTEQKHVTIRIIHGDHATLQTLGIQLKMGTTISPDMGAALMMNIGANFNEDGTRNPNPPENAILVSESYLKAFQLDESAIGTTTLFPAGKIVGVFSDYNHTSLHEKRAPIVIANTLASPAVLIRHTAGTEATLIPKLQQIHAEITGGQPLSYQFVDEILAAYYDADQRQVRLVAIAIGIALTLSLMGLFGMVAFNLERRTKEIGIRKVLGAGIPRLIWLLTRDVYALVALGTVMASPFALQLLNSWLEQYAYRIEPSWGLVLLALLITSVVVATLVIWQAGRAALENPVKALRSE